MALIEKRVGDFKQGGKTSEFIRDYSQLMEAFKVTYSGHVLALSKINCQAAFATWAGNSLSLLSLELYSTSEDLPGGDVIVTNGMGSIIDKLVDDMGQDHIQYQQVVEKIDWSGDRVKVQIKGEEKALEADHVISTLPVGVLESQHEQMFEPALPTKKVPIV